MVNQNLLIVFNRIFATWALILLICGIIFNTLVCYICLVKSKKLRSISTFQFLIIGAINDMLMCFSWNFDCFTDVYFDLRPYMTSLIFCQYFEIFLQYTTISYASWLHVSISLDRVLSLSIAQWTNKYFKRQRPFIFSALLFAAISAIFSISLFKVSYSFKNENGTEIVVCYQDKDKSTFFYELINQVNWNCNNLFISDSYTYN